MPATAQSALHIFGIRHHGPGSARSLRAALEKLKPDIVLIEGPPDANDIIPLAAHADMSPPVAILVYDPDDPRKSCYYPFALFSPEWQALTYALQSKTPVRFMDLPQAHRLGLLECNEETPEAESPSVRRDPLGALAQAAGFPDGERWWEHVVEHRQDGSDLFGAIKDAMSALREDAEFPDDPLDLKREAWMRQTIRAAQKEGHETIAIVCGAWHSPVLTDLDSTTAAADESLLQNLPQTKTKSTWVPWTYGRLASSSGYGAGITSPGWYHHLWQHPDHAIPRWMTRVARLFREEDLDCSPAHVIESVRLAESLAALRNQHLPGLQELNDAARAIFCFDSDAPMRLIARKLIVGEQLGQVPEESAAVPLQQDLAREQKRLRLTPEADFKDIELDLRKETDLDRSRLLHRLTVLGIPWGETNETSGKGTFKEAWRLKWEPEYAVRVIERAPWGNTVRDAAAAYTRHLADTAQDLPALTHLLDQVLLADLPDAVDHLMKSLESEAALASDVAQLMDALPPLANIQRYGNVRQTDAAMVAHATRGLVARICIGLPAAVSSLNDDAATEMLGRIDKVHAAITLLQNQDHTADWQDTLTILANSQSLHGLLAGRAARLLLDQSRFTPDIAATHLSLALSPANDPARAGAWAEGFLKGSAQLLLHDESLFHILDHWITTLHPDSFTTLLPLLRRTFSAFHPPERRQLGEHVKQQQGGPTKRSATATADTDIDPTRAEKVLPILSRLLGLPY